jgi:2-C-methyl-D-erythritol 4-phosphate cytidylyltransferase/2-C-methyl-D-erythritol 2,4-cyclodiphosphate synthase
MTDTVALIVAAGRGHRAGQGIPKQYRKLGEQAVLRRSCLVFLEHPRVDAVRVIIHPDDTALYEETTGGLALLPPVHGGAERQDSCRNGLESLAELSPGHVLIHDAARPFVDQNSLNRVLDALEEGPAAIVAIPVSDTLKRADSDGQITETIPRESLWRAQTPQAFRYREILEAHREMAGRQLTDDAAVAEAAGMTVRVVPGGEDNFKLTTEEDFARAERMLGMTDIRVGAGFDVHRFDEGTAVTLCGIKIPHDMALAGHSDADVGLHAITDAILGAIGEGDIGSHFPPSDPQWRSADSALFLKHAVDLVTNRGGQIRHIDVTLICEAPKIGPHRERMRTRIAEIAGIEADRVSVKATTTEGLGFTGRREGIAAQATATVYL